MNVVEAARTRLAAATGITTLVGAGSVASGAAWDTWIFQWKLFVQMEGTSKSAIVLSSVFGWTAGDEYHTTRFPRLVVEIYSDVSRDSNLNEVAHDAETKAFAVYAAVDAVLHRNRGGVETWGSLRTIDSRRLSEPEIFAVPDGNGLVRLIGNYGVIVG